MSEETKKALLDRGISKLTSRKLLVWITQHGLGFRIKTGFISGLYWWSIRN